ncbi:hypothetical protein CSC64_13125 [Pseudoxanthomonas koreensis]|nr:hypothetical protein CSC64_13125 [Pseudoxanthomonas koreensis]
MKVSGLFFLSGFAALVYQVCWQKQLNALLGVDTLSVALVVVAFMIGLGIGAVIGGQLADRVWNVLLLFVVVELLIATYGAASVKLIAAGAGWGAAGTVETALAAFSVLALPTILMGMTLPVLVIGLDRKIRNIGDSTGTLYFINTVGGAVGALVAGLYLFHFLTIPQVVLVAVAANLMVAVGGGLMIMRGDT